MVKHYDNQGGRFPFQTDTIDISSLATGHDFQVRFRANGIDNLQTTRWDISNVYVYQYFPGNLTGTITLPSGAPAEGVIVKVINGCSFSDTTGTDGSYSFINLNQGKYAINCTKNGYTTYTDSITIAGNQNKIKDIQLQYHSLPFIEDWSSGSFDTNAWTFDPDNNNGNWSYYYNFDKKNPLHPDIEHVSKNPLHPYVWAEFKPMSYISNYSYALVSEQLNATNTGPIYLQYKIQLTSNASTVENMDIEVFDGNTWNLAKHYDNQGGAFTWKNDTLNISSWATGHAFQVRFRANGTTNFGNTSWDINDVYINQECPGNLTGTVTTLPSGTPAKGALITLINGPYTISDTTGVDGNYFFTGVNAGKYAIVCKDFYGYINYSDSITIVTNQTATKDIQLQQQTPVALPFTEDWSSNNFSNNSWTFYPNSDWWLLSGVGNNKFDNKFAEYHWSPLTNYESSLQSELFDASDISDNLILKYDIYFNGIFTSTSECMAVEVYDGTSWHLVHDYNNQQGSIAWRRDAYDISSIAAGHNMGIRFRAHGENADNFNWWFIDNVHIYKQVTGNIAGTVTRLSDGSPIEGAMVALIDTFSFIPGQTQIKTIRHTTTTATDGSYVINNAEAGQYIISCSKDGYNIVNDSITIGENQTQTKIFSLTNPSMSIIPDSVNTTGTTGQIVTTTISVTNNGNGPLTWSGLVLTNNQKLPAIPPDQTIANSVKNTKGNTAYAFTECYYSFNTDDPSNATIIARYYEVHEMTGCTFNATNTDFMYSLDQLGNHLRKVDVISGDVTDIGYTALEIGELWTGLSCDKTTGILYGCSTSYGSHNTSSIYTINPANGNSTIIGHLAIPILAGITIDGTGQMYGCDLRGNIYAIDKTNCTFTQIGNGNLTNTGPSGIAWDPASNNIYLNDWEYLYTFDKANGTLINAGTLNVTPYTFAFPGIGANWLSISPKFGTIPAGTTQDITVTLDGSQIQKGTTLNGNIVFASDPNVDSITVPVTFKLQEDIYGQITGNVTHNGTGIAGVTLKVQEQSNNTSYTATSNADGSYTFPQVLAGTYEMTATNVGYNPYSIADIVITGGQSTTQDVEMTAPTMNLNPLAIVDSAVIGEIKTQTVTITNTGDGPLTWNGMLQLNGEQNLIPASNGDFIHSPASIGRASIANKTNATDTHKGANGSMAYGFDLINHLFMSINTDDPANPTTITNVNVQPFGGTFDASHTNFMYIIDNNDGNIKKVDAATGNITTVGPAGLQSGDIPSGLSCDKITGTLYASSTNGSESSIYMIDSITGASTFIGTTGIPALINIAIDGNGQMYGYDIAGDNAYKIDKTTGASTLIGSIGFDANYVQGMGWDPESNNIYLAAYNATTSSGELRILDKTTGNTTLVGQLSSEIDGFAFPGGAWLSIDPETGIVPAGTSMDVTVTLNGNYIPSQKDYTLTGDINFMSDPNVGTATVPVTFTIQGNIYGMLTGTVTHNGIAIPNVTVTATKSGNHFTAISGADGVYIFPQILSGTYDISTAAVGYNSYSITGVTITGGQTTIIPITLTSPVMNINPLSLIATIPVGQATDQTITINNTGDGMLGWVGTFLVNNKQQISIPASDGNFEHGTAPISIGRAPNTVDASPAVIKNLFRGANGYAFDINNNNFFSFNTDDPSNPTVISSTTIAPFGGTFDAMNTDFMYIIDYNDSHLKKVNVTTGDVTNIGAAATTGGSQSFTGLTCDMNTGILYAVSSDINESYIYTINPATATTTVIGATGIPGCIDITIDGTGQMYGYDIVGDNSYKIDKATGTSTLLGSIGYDANFAQGMGYDSKNDIIYLAAYNVAKSTGELRILDRVTGNTVLVGSFAGETDGLAFPKDSWLTIAPKTGLIPAGSSQNVTVHFDATNITGGTYNASITFNSDPYVGSVTIPVTLNVTSDVTVLTITPSNQNVTADAGSTTFAVANNGTGTMNYTAEVTSGSDWLTITSGGSGVNTGTINVAYTENMLTSPRTGTITVTAPGATGSPVMVTVTQAVNPALLPTLIISTLTDVVAGPVFVPVHAANIVNMGSFQFTIEYDPALMTYSSASDWYTGIEAVTMGEPIPGHLTFVWAADMNGINIADGTFFNLNFNWLGSTSTSSLTWSDNPTPREFTDYDGNVFVSVYNNGSVTGSPSQPILTVTPTNQDVTSSAGTTTFAVANTGIGTMNYTAAVTTGNDWLTITSGGSGVNTGTINVAYTENTSTSPRTGTITVTAPGATGSPVQVTVTQAAASVPAAIVTITDTTTLVSGLFVVPVHAENITNMGSFQFTIEYDPSIILFDSITNWHAGIDAVTTGNPSAGHITFVWAADLNGINIADGNFFDINFDWIASDVIQTQVNWSDNPTPREFADYNGNIFVPVYNNGTETGPDGIPEIGSSSVKVFPNPATDVVNITVSNNISTVQVINCLGMVVHSENITQEKTITLNTSRYSAGNYLVRFVTNNGQTLIKKMVIIK